MSFVKVPVQVLDYNLTSTELKLFVYLSSIQQKKTCITVRIRTMQQRLAIGSHVTIQKALRGLEEKGLLTRRLRQDRTGRKLASSYSIKTFSGAWFPLTVYENVWSLSKSAFSVYLYMLRLCRENGRAWPSYQAIADALHIAKRTIITAMKELIEYGLVLKAAFWKGKHNLYTLFIPVNKTETEHKSDAKEKAATSTPLRPSHNMWKYNPISNFILHTWVPYVNRKDVLLQKKWCKNYLSPTGNRSIPVYCSKESNIYLYVSLYPLVGGFWGPIQQRDRVKCALFYPLEISSSSRVAPLRPCQRPP